MRIGLMLEAIALLSACGQSDRADAPMSINEMADRLDAHLNEVEAEVKAAMMADAQRCGTSVVFHDKREPLVVNDRPYVWWIAPSATAEQIACVQRTHPELPTAPK